MTTTATPTKLRDGYRDTRVAGADPRGIFKPGASPTRARCARCGRKAMWIAGVDEALCVWHQDDYRTEER